MAIAKTVGKKEDATNRVEWPEFPQTSSLKPEEEKALREWYASLRESVDRTILRMSESINSKG